jgi:hypothetical protein
LFNWQKQRYYQIANPTKTELIIHTYTPIKMEFPITRERLQHFQAEYKEIQNEKFISNVVDGLTHKIFEIAGQQNGMNPTTMLQVMIRELGDQRKYGRMFFGLLTDYIPQIMNKLQERFPDTTITMDPMKTYLYIDWS